MELFHNERTDDIHIVEINPRMCGQFADMMQAVNGTNTYEILFALAMGHQPPPVRRKAQLKVATSFVLRHFQDARVTRTPSAQQLQTIKARFPVTLLSTFYQEGQRLSDSEYQSDGYSYRYAVVNMAGANRVALTEDFEMLRARLDFGLIDEETSQSGESESPTPNDSSTPHLHEGEGQDGRVVPHVGERGPM
jgi:hypothetical protein